MDDYPPAMPVDPILIGAVDVQGVVTTDLPCRKCSYNLRGLTIDGRCPECGAAVGLSVQGDLLRFSNPAWVRTLQRGVRLIIWGVVVIILGALLAVVLAVTVPAVGLAAVAVPLVGYVLTLVGTWRLTEPDPSGLGEDQYGTSRRLIRITLVMGVIDAALDVVSELITVPPMIAVALLFLAIVFGIAGVVGLFAQLQYLKKLALRIPDVKLAGRAHFLMYGLGIGYGLFALVGVSVAIATRFGAGGAAGPPIGIVGALGCSAAVIGVAVIVFAIMYLLMLERMGKRFGEEAHLAEDTWARLDAPPSPATT